MNTLYLIGGSPRTGKSTVVEQILKERPMPFISTDALRFALRSALFNEPYVSVDELEFTGKAVFRRPGEQGSHSKQFSKDIHEDALAWDAALGFIDFYDRGDKPLLMEGMVITPERVHDLKLKKLSIRAVFLGYNDISHLTTILEHASSNSSNWINKLIAEKGGDTTYVKASVAQEVERNKVVAKLCAEYGYGYFDVTSQPFAEHTEDIKEFLRQN